MSIEGTRKPGRPPVFITWPEGEFTVQQIRDATNLSKVTIYQKLDEAILKGAISKVGKESSRQGRPRDLFRKTLSNPTTATTSVTTHSTPVATDATEALQASPTVA